MEDEGDVDRSLIDGESSEFADLNEEHVEIEDSSVEDTTNALKEQFEKYTKENVYLKKYFALRKRCEQAQQTNEKLVNRIHNVKKVIKRYKNERRFLIGKLDELGDKYEEAQVPAVWEEDQLYKRLAPETTAKDPVAQDTPTPSASHSKLAGLHPILSSLSDAAQTKKTKVERDPNAPKKPANAFLLFCQKHRGNVQEQYLNENNHDIANYELTKRLAQQWNSLDKDDKTVFFEMYEREKERYTQEMKTYMKREESGGGGARQVRDTLSQDDEVYRNLIAIKQELGLKTEKN